MSDFANEPVAVEQLPQLADEAFTPVHPNYLKARMLTTAAVALVVFVVGIVSAIMVDEKEWIFLVIMAVVLALIALYAALTVVAVRRMAYQVREHDLSYRSGILIQTVSTVPFVRVQHAKVRQGPLLRQFGLATLEVNSAGPDLSIDGIGEDLAERLKALVIERAGDLIEEG